MAECRKRLSFQADDDISSRNSPIQDFSTKNIMNMFRLKLQHDLNKLCNYDTHKIKWVNEKPKQERKAYQPTEVNTIQFLIVCFIVVYSLHHPHVADFLSPKHNFTLMI